MKASRKKLIPPISRMCSKASRRRSVGSSQQMRRSGLSSAASNDEAAIHAACGAKLGGHCRLHRRTKSAGGKSRSCRDPEIASASGLVSADCRRQRVEGVRKLVTRPYPCLVYYAIDREIIILAIRH